MTAENPSCAPLQKWMTATASLWKIGSSSFLNMKLPSLQSDEETGPFTAGSARKNPGAEIACENMNGQQKINLFVGKLHSLFWR